VLKNLQTPHSGIENFRRISFIFSEIVGGGGNYGGTG